MKFYGIAALALALACSPVAAQEAGDFKMEYQELSAVDPVLAPFWKDYIEIIPSDGVVPASILAQSFPTSTGGEMTVSYFTGSGVCGLQNCTVRVIEDGVIIDSFDVCRAPEKHYLSADGKAFIACGVERLIGTNPIPLPN